MAKDYGICSNGGAISELTLNAEVGSSRPIKVVWNDRKVPDDETHFVEISFV